VSLRGASHLVVKGPGPVKASIWPENCKLTPVTSCHNVRRDRLATRPNDKRQPPAAGRPEDDKP